MFGDDGQVIHFNAPKGQPAPPQRKSEQLAQFLSTRQSTLPFPATSSPSTEPLNPSPSPTSSPVSSFVLSISTPPLTCRYSPRRIGPTRT